MSTQLNHSPAAIVRKIGYCLLPVVLGVGAAPILLLWPAAGLGQPTRPR